MAAADEPGAKSPKSIGLEILIADAPDGTSEALQPTAILALDKAGKLSSVSRYRLTVMENQRASVQFTELTPRATGRTMVGGFSRGGDGAGPRSNTVYSDVSIGTTLSAVAGMADDGQIALDLKVTRARIVPHKAEAQPDAAADFTPSSLATLTLESSLKVKPGEPTLVGGRQTTSGKETAQTWVVVTVNVAGGSGTGTTSKTSAAPAAANEIKIFRLKYASADQLAPVLQQVFIGSPLTIAADARANALLVRGPTERLNALSGLLPELDTDRTRR
jgi:type II secretory pathway component GspD/PulD (secretin)